MSHDVLWHGIRPSVNGREKRLALSGHPAGEILANQFDDIGIGGREQVGGFITDDKAAQGCQMRWNPDRKFDIYPGSGSQDVALACGNQETEAIERMAESRAVIYERHENGR